MTNRALALEMHALIAIKKVVFIGCRCGEIVRQSILKLGALAANHCSSIIKIHTISPK